MKELEIKDIEQVKQEESYFSHLPAEVFYEILRHLSPNLIFNLAWINKQFNRILSNEIFWKNEIKNNHPFIFALLSKLSYQETINWYAEFRELYRAKNLSKNPLKLEDLDQAVIDWPKKLGNSRAKFDYIYQNVVLKFYADSTGLSIDPNKVDACKRTALHWAIFYQQPPEILEWMILQGINAHAVGDGLTAFLVATQEGHTEAVKLLMAKGADVNARSSKGATGLFFAVELGYTDIVDILLAAKADKLLPLREDSSWHNRFKVKAGDTPLHVAIKLGRLEIFQKLYNASADIHALNADNFDALSLAAEQNRVDIVNFLIQKNDCRRKEYVNNSHPSNTSALFIAVEKGHKAIVDIFLKADASFALSLQINNEYYKKCKAEAKEIALHVAIRQGNLDIVKSLLNYDADKQLQILSAEGLTPLQMAALGGHAEIVQFLIKKNANVNYQNPHGITAFFLAVIMNHADVIDVLIDHKPNILIRLKTKDYYSLFKINENEDALLASIRLGQKETIKKLLDKGYFDILNREDIGALRLAAQEDQVDIVDLLLSQDMDINMRSPFGATAFLVAVENARKKMINHLIKCGADISIPLKKSNAYHDYFKVKPGDTPLHAAIKLGQIDTVEILLSHGANINAVNGEDLNALQLAIAENQTDIAKFLIQNGADITAKNSIGFDALRLAAVKGKWEIIDILIKHGADVNIGQNTGETALLLAVENKHENCVEILLKHNADPSIPLKINTAYHDKFSAHVGHTPLHVAIKNNMASHIIHRLVDQIAAFKCLTETNSDPLLLAATVGYADLAEILIKKGHPINVISKSGATALILATENRNDKVVDVLLNYNADVSVKLKDNNDYHKNFYAEVGDVALFLAIKLNYLEIAKAIMIQGIPHNTLLEMGAHPVILSVVTNQVEVLKLLIKKGGNVNARSHFSRASALLLAVELNYEKILEILLNHNADASLALEIESSYHRQFGLTQGDTPLSAAIRLGYQNIVKKLINKNGLDPQALRFAAKIGQTEMIELLIALGADIDAHDNTGETALFLAAANAHINAVKVLLKHHANASIELQVNNDYYKQLSILPGDTPLHVAIKLNFKEIAGYLINQDTLKSSMRAGAFFEINFNLLFLAAIEGQADIVEDILSRNPHAVNAMNPSGATPLLLAVENGHLNVVRILLKYNANTSISLNRSNLYHNQFGVIKGDTPLHAAAKLGKVSIIRCLIQANADIEQMNSICRTPVMEVKENNAVYAYELKLLQYTAKAIHEKQEKKFYGFFDKYHLKAAQSVKSVVFDGASKTTLEAYRKDLNKDQELKDICQGLKLL